MLDDSSKIIEIVCNEFKEKFLKENIFVQEIFKKLTNWDQFIHSIKIV